MVRVYEQRQRRKLEGASVLKSFLKTFQELVYVERFSASKGVLQRINPQVKFVCLAAFILSAVAVRTILPLAILLAVIVILCVLSKIPLKFFFVRATVFIPLFAAAIALPLLFITPGRPMVEVGYAGLVARVTVEGAYKAVQFTFRIWICVASLILLVLTTKFSRLIQAMKNFKLPNVFITMTAITYRFIFLFINEAYRMALAKESRTVAKEPRMRAIRSFANMITTLFIRSYERGERVYLAMIARGYSGTVKSSSKMRFALRDWFFVGASMVVCFMVLSVEYLPLGGW